jgi:hypothetical protein
MPGGKQNISMVAIATPPVVPRFLFSNERLSMITRNVEE